LTLETKNGKINNVNSA